MKLTWRALTSACGVLVLGLGLAACGDGNDDAPDLPEQAAAPAALAPVPPAPIPNVTPETPAPTPAAAQPVAPAPEPIPAPVEPPAAVPPEPVPTPAPPPAQPAAAAAEPAPTPVAPPAAAPAPAVDAAAIAPPPDTPELLAALAAADIDTGRVISSRCSACHTFDQGGATLVGPNLYGVVGAPVGGASGYSYSPALQALRAAGATWTYGRLEAFLANPQAAIPGTAMTFAGLTHPDDRLNLVAYLRTLSANPLPLPGATEAVAAPAAATIDPALLQRLVAADTTAGQIAASARCSGCHSLNEGGATLIGPNLFAIVDRPIGIVEGFAYSPAMQALSTSGAIWTLDRLEAFIQSPQSAVPGTRMGFLGLADGTERANLLAYLRTLTTGPLAPLAAGDAATPAARANGLAPLAFVQLQSVRGRNTYDEIGCGDCHGPTLRGMEPNSDRTGGPALRGEEFAARWFNGNVWELYKLMRDTMPPAEAGGYTGDVYIVLLAFILRENELVAEPVWLDPDRAVLEGMGFYP